MTHVQGASTCKPYLINQWVQTILLRIPYRISYRLLGKIGLKSCAFPLVTASRKSGESSRPLTPILLKSIAIHLPFLSRQSCKSMHSWQKVVYMTPICITIRLAFVSRYFGPSIGARGVGTPPKRVQPTNCRG